MNKALFRPGTSDRNIWLNVVDKDEYRLPQMTENDWCIDIGANTGASTFAMLQKGAGKVIAFEPDIDNYILLRKQLKQEIRDGRVEAHPLAVVGGSGFSWRTFSGVVQKDGEVNYGGAYLFTEDGRDTFGYAKYMMRNPVKVPCIGFEEIEELIPDSFGGKRKLVKLDCEGSEWGIIYSNPKFHSLEKWEQVVGEYHPITNENPSAIGLYLPDHRVTVQPHENSNLGLFFATRQ